METVLPIAILSGLAVALCGGILAITSVLGPKAPSKSKLSPYECGVKPEGDARFPFRNRFYVIAVLFLIFDVEAAFFLPWALVYRESLADGPSLLIAMGIYLAFLILGLAYIFRKNVLEIR